MSKTQEDLITQALEELGVLAAGQTAEAEDIAKAVRVYGPMLDMLMARNLYSLGDPDVIEDEAFLPLAARLAQEMAPSFGIPRDLTEIARAEGLLIEIQPRHVSDDPIPAEYF